MSTVVPLRGVDTGTAARVLARAFDNDPFMMYIFPSTWWRRRVLPVFLGGVLRYCHRYGEVWTTPDVAGVACWLPPGQVGVTPTRALRTGIASVMPLMGRGGLLRFSRLVPAMEQAHFEQMGDPHWYLWLLGTEPSRVRHGVAGAVLGPVLRRADEAAVSAYLNTHLEANLSFYRRHGFESVGDQTVDGLRVWGLRRDPR